MANFVYGKAKQNILNGNINFSSNNFKVLFTNSTYVPNQNTHQFVSDILSSSVVYRSENIQNITNVLGVVDANDFNFSLPPNTALQAAILYQVGVNDSSSILLLYIDTATGLPFPGSSQSTTVSVNWSNEASKILSL
jgi:hypothetical protein